ncbi:MAG TPA: ComEC/Rec2 family competence protein [Candidatus Saccharimonadales bacterium]|nr:ComEC/Rec2 family competence protein [Candidatus Saccharimonadales bacterium]
MNLWVLRTRIHVSWLVAVLSLGIVIGVIILPYLAIGWFGSVVWLFLGSSLMLIGLWRQRAYVLPLMLIAGSLIGLWRGSITQQQLAPYTQLIGQQLTITGKVSEDVDIGKAGELVLRLHVMHINNHPMTGNIWASTTVNADIKRGDFVTIRGQLAEGFGSFAGSVFRAELVNVQRPQPGDVARQARDEFADNVRIAIPEPEASLGIGYLVGQRRALPPELSQALQIAGLTHIVVASGYNLTILVRLTRRLFVKVSKYLATASAGGMIIAFIAVTGMSPSMSRAGLIAGLSLLAWYYGRKVHPLVLLPFAAAVTLLVNPSYGWNDLGWQLSFAAFAGVMIVAPLAQRYFFGDKKPGTVRQILGETISAQIATLPILVLAFGQFSNVAIVANLLVLPLVPLAMLLTFVAGIGTIITASAATLIGLPASWLLQYMTTIAQYLAGLSWAQTDLIINGTIVAVYYLALVAVCVYMRQKTSFNLRDSNLVE